MTNPTEVGHVRLESLAGLVGVSICYGLCDGEVLPQHFSSVEEVDEYRVCSGPAEVH